MPHRHFFDYFINKMKETCQLNRIRKKRQSKPRSDSGAAGEFVSMGIQNTISAFALIASAILLAAVLCLIEVAFGYKHDKSNNMSAQLISEIQDVQKCE